MCHKVPHRIDVLCDDRLEAAGLVEARQGPVALVGLGIPHLGIPLDLPALILPTGGRVGQELGQLDGPHLLPDPLRTAEIRDAALGGDPRPCEGHHVAAGTYQGSEIFDLVLQFRRQHGLHNYSRFTPPVSNSCFSSWVSPDPMSLLGALKVSTLVKA
ncbi:MAG: hypothetical protein V3V47_03900 [Desulfobacteria bacterium]